MKKLLAIDGGGIRGLISALVLQEIEKRVGKPCAEIFDCIGGTSAGGILALGLTSPDPTRPGKPRYSASQLVDLFRTQGPQIFSRSLTHEIRTVGGAFGPKYPGSSPEAVLKNYFQDAMLSQCLKPTLALAYEIHLRSPFFFRSWRAKGEESAAYDFLVADVARATSAAPTYFPPVQASAKNGKHYTLVDGGVFANNPALCLYIDLIREIEKGYEGQILLVSVGTGNPTRPLQYRKARRWGLLCWAQRLIDIFIDGAGDAVDFQLRELLSGHGARHGDPGRDPEPPASTLFRFQGDVPEEAQDLDDTSPATLAILAEAAERILKSSASELDRLCRELALPEG